MVKEFQIGGCWITTDEDKLFKTKNVLYHRIWEYNASSVAEVIILLELLTVLKWKGQYITKEKIKIRFDNRKRHDRIMGGIYKYNEYAQGAGGKISMIKMLIKKIKFDINI